ncbi:phosphate signaling complex PhoU family protein [Stetteria hydrogenophila]
MATPREAEARIKDLIARLHARVDEFFGEILESIKAGRRLSLDAVDEKLALIEELRLNTAIESLLYIARWQPLGRDLARAEGYIRTSYSLYRIARYLREIARLDEATGPLREAGVNLDALAKAREMTSNAVKALLEENTWLANEVEKADKDIDKYYEESLKKLNQDPIPRNTAIQALFARHVERIADHATYIAELLTNPIK